MNIAKHGQNKDYKCELLHPHVLRLPRAPSQELRVFEFSLDYVRKMFGEDILPYPGCYVSTLCRLGARKGTWRGFSGRPIFPEANRVLDLVVAGLTDCGLRSNFHLGHVTFPKGLQCAGVEIFDEDRMRTAAASGKK